MNGGHCRSVKRIDKLNNESQKSSTRDIQQTRRSRYKARRK